MKIRSVHPAHGLHGWSLHVDDTPLLEVVWVWVYDALLTALGSPCCYHRHGTERRTWAGWIYDHLRDDLDNEATGHRWSMRGQFQVLQFRLMSNRFTNRTWAKEVLRLPITESQARALNPAFVDRCIADMAEDEPPKASVYLSPFNVTTSSASSITVSYSNGTNLI